MEEITMFRMITESLLSDEEKDLTGVGRQKDRFRQMDEDVVGYKIGSYNDPEMGSLLKPIQGKDSDGELVFMFEDMDDAIDMYTFFVEAKLLEPGEIVLRNIEEQHSVAFMPSVIVQKPELINAAILAYEDRLYADDEEDVEAFESVIDGVSDLLDEASGTRTSGAPKRKAGMGNPFHDRDDGKFTGAENHASKGGGSWAIGKRKLKFTGKGKNKDGGLLVKYGSTKHPCGRAARKKGKNIRCWDGSGGAGARIASIMKGKKRAKEDINVADLSFLMEMRAKYNR
jgi:hypothetical protein